MSTFGIRTAVCGMDAQVSRIAAVSDNIANVDTVSYKRSSALFSLFIFPSVGGGSYSSGAVETAVRHSISAQGALTHTGVDKDLAIDGNGFFVVESEAHRPYLTRSGSFKGSKEGYLQNNAGYLLLGSLYSEKQPDLIVNGFAGLSKINVRDFELKAKPTTKGSMRINLDKDAKVVTGDLPKDNKRASTYTNKLSFTAYDSLGSAVLYDVYYTKIEKERWEMTIFRKDQETTENSFPFIGKKEDGSTPHLVSVNLSFDPSTGHLRDGEQKEVSFTDSISGVDQEIDIDISAMTQLAGDFSSQNADFDGQAPSGMEKVKIDKDGVVSIVYKDGSLSSTYRLALANIPSVDNLLADSGNVYLPTRNSGEVNFGFANRGQFGEIVPGALEDSNVDIAHELTDLIEAQRNYVANSKVFQTGSELMDVLISLKR